MNFSTIILRFRDLVTESNETINKHIEIINEKGYVWWRGEIKGMNAFQQHIFRSLHLK